MAIRLVVAVTDGGWFDHLSSRPDLTEVNFWSPGKQPFRALSTGELFLFKLHSPLNFIVGGGIFTHAATMPCSLAWEAFGESNGASSFEEMRARIAKYRRIESIDRTDFAIGCRVLSQPFFLDRSDWIPVPPSWSPNIVSFKTYSTGDVDGLELWCRVENLLSESQVDAGLAEEKDRYGSPTLIRPRIGQGGFRLMVTDAYGRQCAVTRERTLPALEAAHIKPFSQGGSHETRNGLLLRRDIHSLFDAGYVTVTPDLHFEVSRRIREEFENGRDYYRLHGTQLIVPDRVEARPDPKKLDWHNSEKYMGGG